MKYQQALTKNIPSFVNVICIIATNRLPIIMYGFIGLAYERATKAILMLNYQERASSSNGSVLILAAKSRKAVLNPSSITG